MCRKFRAVQPLSSGTQIEVLSPVSERTANEQTSRQRARGTVIDTEASIDVSSEREIVTAEIMTTDLAAIPSWISMAAARKIAALKKAEHLLVEDHGQLVGVVSGMDVVAAPAEDTVGAWTTRARISVSPMTSLARARHLMAKNRLPCLPVLAGSFLVGLVTREAVERAIARAARMEQVRLGSTQAAVPAELAPSP
jgi:CBS domain-containing protein